LLLISLLYVAFIAACALFSPQIAPYDPIRMSPGEALQPPSLAHLFGTDHFGRDVFSIVIYGSRVSLLMGVSSVLIGGIVGGLFGALAGYIGGWVDTVFMRIIDVLMTIPNILLAMTIAAALGPSLFNMVLAIAVSSIPAYARVMRGQTLSVKNRPFVMATRSIGTREIRIFFRHVLANSWSPFLVMATIGLGGSILAAAGMSFLGLGVFREIPDWGSLLSQGRGYITVAWWICTFPGLVVTIFVLSINIIGDKLRDMIDPK
jgi:peptide/nickel transport system permease protein